MLNRVLFLLGLLFWSVASLIAAEVPPASDRSVYDFNREWKVMVGDPAGAQGISFPDASWKAVTLPHAWNEDEAFAKDIKDHSTGIAWYRKQFTLPESAQGKKIFIEFEGVRHAGEFFLNGHSLGLHENGVMAVGFDLTNFIKPYPEINVIAVRTDNAWTYKEQKTGQRYQWADSNFNANYGGIPKNVRLHITDRLHQTLPLYSALATTGVYVYGSDFDLAKQAVTVNVESEVRNDYGEGRRFTLEVQVADLDGKTVQTFRSPTSTTLDAGKSTVVRTSKRLEGVHFWSWGYGYLYSVYTTLKVEGKPVDTVQTRTGFRKTEFGHGLIKLNDRVIQVHGYAQRTSNEWPAIGLSVPPWLSDFSNRMMVEGNGNLVRWMHVTPWKQDVESCDRVGLIQAMPAGDSERDVSDRRWGQRVELMRDAIIYNRNNPSILFYECGNENISEEHMHEMKALRDRYDPHGGRAIGSREMLDSQEADYGGEMLYVNKSARLPFWATEYSRDEGLRKYWDELSPPYHKDGDGPPYKNEPAPTYNRNQDTHAVENVVRWYDFWRERPGTGSRVSSGGVNIIFSDTNTHHRGAENYRRSGEVDAMRIPKDGFYAHQVMWDGWVDPERPGLHIIGHWNYRAGDKKNVYVVSTAESVELIVNDKSLGKGQKRHGFLFTFPDVAFVPGSVRAVGYDQGGQEICRGEHRTAGEPAALRLKSMISPNGWRADGADLALVEVEVVDTNGQRCPIALNLVEFEVTGPAEWRGGLAQGPNNYVLAKALPVECGVNRVLLRSTTTAGEIVVHARSAGLKDAQVSLVTKNVPTTKGLSDLPAALPSYLDRGPTPATPSFKVSRIALPFTAVKAGSNSAEAKSSYDDNEMTEWKSDNQISQAWIEYDFGRQATPHELTLKLTGWRQRGYPIRVTLDGQEVFKGVTPRSLGYVTLPLTRKTGQHLRIELLDRSAAQDSYRLIEVERQANTETGAASVGAETLSIIECECYEPAS